MKKSPLSNKEKENFINFLSGSSPEEINEFIKQNGKNNSNDKLFVFQWDNLKKDENKKVIL